MSKETSETLLEGIKKNAKQVLDLQDMEFMFQASGVRLTVSQLLDAVTELQTREAKWKARAEFCRSITQTGWAVIDRVIEWKNRAS